MSESVTANTLLKEIKIENLDSYGVFLPLFGVA